MTDSRLRSILPKLKLDWLRSFPNYLPIIAPVIVSFAIWWNPNFLTPGSYTNFGDILFPLNPSKYLDASYYTWISGSTANYWLAYRPIAFLVALPSYLDIPLWLLNRLYLLLPSAMIGWFTYYLYRSLFIEKYSRPAGVLASVFVMLTPVFLGNTQYDFALAGFLLVLGSLIRGLNTKTDWFKYVFLVVLGSLIMGGTPLISYLAIIICIPLLGFKFLIDRSLFNLRSLKFISCSFVVMLLVHMYWILPFVYFQMQQDVIASVYEGYPSGFTGFSLLSQYSANLWTGLSWIMRLTTSNPSSPTHPYYILPFITIIFFLIPIYAYSSLLIVKNRNLYPVTIMALIVTFFGMAPYYDSTFKIYEFLWSHMPGFSILYVPLLWLVFLAVFYGILIGATTQGLLFWIDTSRFLERYGSKIRRGSRIFVFIALFLVIGASGYPVLIGIGPTEGVWGNRIFSNHASSAKIPSAYYDLEAYLSSYTSKEDRVLNLPWPSGGYAAYTWWHDSNMPDVVAFLSPVPTIGTSLVPNKQENQILVAVNGNMGDAAAYQMTNIGIKYIVVHKDYYPIEGIDMMTDPSNYLKTFADCDAFIEVMDNEYFTLYQLNRDPLYPDVIASYRMDVSVLIFDGDDYVFIPNSESLSPSGSLTITAWVQPRVTDTNQSVAMKWAGNNSYQDNYGLALDPDNNLVFAINFDGKDYIGHGGGTYVYGPWHSIHHYTLEENNWYFATAVYESDSHRWTIYQNGVPVRSSIVNTSGNMSVSDTPFLIGARPVHKSGADMFFQGLLHNVQVYNEPLSDLQIIELFQKGISGDAINDQGLVGWWLMQGADESTIPDLSGQNNDGILMGTPEWRYVSVDTPVSGIRQVQDYKFEMISPTEYRVSVDSTSPFYLFLDERFHPLWVAYIDGNEVTRHTVSDLGTNKWYIDKTGHVDIDLRFRPQIFADVGTLISIGSFLVLLASFCVGYLRCNWSTLIAKLRTMW